MSFIPYKLYDAKRESGDTDFTNQEIGFTTAVSGGAPFMFVDENVSVNNYLLGNNILHDSTTGKQLTVGFTGSIRVDNPSLFAYFHTFPPSTESALIEGVTWNSTDTMNAPVLPSPYTMWHYIEQYGTTVMKDNDGYDVTDGINGSGNTVPEHFETPLLSPFHTGANHKLWLGKISLTRYRNRAWRVTIEIDDSQYGYSSYPRIYGLSIWEKTTGLDSPDGGTYTQITGSPINCGGGGFCNISGVTVSLTTNPYTGGYTT
jgi:hypothetical protein